MQPINGDSLVEGLLVVAQMFQLNPALWYDMVDIRAQLLVVGNSNDLLTK